MCEDIFRISLGSRLRAVESKDSLLALSYLEPVQETLEWSVKCEPSRLYQRLERRDNLADCIVHTGERIGKHKAHMKIAGKYDDTEVRAIHLLAGQPSPESMGVPLIINLSLTTMNLLCSVLCAHIVAEVRA